MEEPRQRRVTDTSNADARRAISAVMVQFAAWRVDIAQYTAWSDRRFTEAQRQEMLARCEVIKSEVQEARVSLIVGLLDAPRRVAGHGRVADVEKALDGVDASASALLRKLRPARGNYREPGQHPGHSDLRY